MTDLEINEFIEQMEEIGDQWEFEDVRRVYGNSTLQSALQERKASLGILFDILGKTLL